jgi:2,4-dienoyl-CoA reductase (NADPH2)
VTVVELRAEMALDIDYWNRWVLLDRLESAGLRMIVDARPESITPEGVRVSIEGGPAELIPADTVVYAVGARPCNPLQEALDGKVPALKVIGDGGEPQRVRQAIDAGFRCGMEI